MSEYMVLIEGGLNGFLTLYKGEDKKIANEVFESGDPGEYAELWFGGHSSNKTFRKLVAEKIRKVIEDKKKTDPNYQLVLYQNRQAIKRRPPIEK